MTARHIGRAPAYVVAEVLDGAFVGSRSPMNACGLRPNPYASTPLDELRERMAREARVASFEFAQHMRRVGAKG